MPCQCRHPVTIFTHYCTVVCTSCGHESQQILNPSDDTTYHAHHPTPINHRLYNRPDRWKSLVRKVVGIHSGPPKHDPIWNCLEKNRHNISDVSDIYKVLRKSGLKHKHYQSAHIFAKCFAKNYIKPRHSPTLVETHLNAYFAHIQRMWNAAQFDFFFSYAWLLEQGLYVFSHLEYLPYVKTLICKRRRNKYVQMLLTLYKIHAEKSNRGSSNIHSQSALSHSSIPHNQLWMRPNHDHVGAHAELNEVPSVEGSEHDLERMCAGFRGGSQKSAASHVPSQSRRELILAHLESLHNENTLQPPRRTTPRLPLLPPLNGPQNHPHT